MGQAVVFLNPSCLHGLALHVKAAGLLDLDCVAEIRATRCNRPLLLNSSSIGAAAQSSATTSSLAMMML